VHDQVPNVLADLSSSWLTSHNHLAMVEFFQPIGNAPDLGGFPASLGTFEGD
tara:strand:+ start:126 stop:281 length:156 start_codon:yes stop_codon:yes gene_type:complete